MYSSRLIGKRLDSEAYPATLIVLVVATFVVAPLRSFLDLSNVALLVGHLTASLRSHAEIVEAQAVQTKSLYEFARQLTATRSSEAVIEAGLNFLAHAVGADEARFVATGQLDSLDDPASRLLLHSGIERRHLVLHRADAQTGKGRVMAVLPLRTLDVEQGIIRFCIDGAQVESTSQQEFLETVGSLIAVALERTHYLEMARDIEVRHAAESLRNTILSSLSHDIRTPLTALVGTADTLLMTQALPREKQLTLLQGLREQAQSIHQFVNNLLDMARLQSGSVELNLAWQPIEEVVGAALQQIRTVAESRVIELDIEKDLPRMALTLAPRTLKSLA